MGLPPGLRALMPKRNKTARKSESALDKFSRKRGRGRPPKVTPSEIRGRGDNYRGIFGQVWDQFWPLLSQAQTEQDVVRAFEEGASPYGRKFVPLAGLTLRVVHESEVSKANAVADQFPRRFVGRLRMD